MDEQVVKPRRSAAHRIGEGTGRGSSGDLVGRLGATTLPCHLTGTIAERFNRDAARLHGSPGRICLDRLATGYGRYLRCDVLPRRTTNPRDRHPYGAGCAHERCAQADDQSRDETDDGWCSHRITIRILVDSLYVELIVQHWRD